MGLTSYNIKNNALVLSHSQATRNSKQQNSVYSYGDSHGDDYKSEFVVFMEKVETIRFHSFTSRNFTKTSDYTGTCLLTAWFQYDGGKIMRVNVDLAIRYMPLKSKMAFKRQITLRNISAKVSCKLIILKRCDELIIQNRFRLIPLILQMTHGKFSMQKRLL